MPRDTDQERRDNINRGVPAHRGLDDGTKASLRRALEDRDEGIKVGSFRDLQMGLTDTPLEDRPVNPNQSEEGLVTLPDHVAAEAAVSGTDTSGTDAGVTAYDDSYTLEELRDAAVDKGLATSGTKAELIARLNT